MKKQIILVICFGVTLMMLSLLINNISKHQNKSKLPDTYFGYTQYILPQEISLAIFGADPNGFFDHYYSYNDGCEDFRKKASVDSKGNLVLCLNEEQKITLKNSSNDAITGAKEKGVFIEEDYTGYIIECDPNDLQSSLLNRPLYLERDMIIHQLLAGYDPATLSVQCTFKYKNGEVFYSVNWPKEAVDIRFVGGEFVN